MLGAVGLAVARLLESGEAGIPIASGALWAYTSGRHVRPPPINDKRLPSLPKTADERRAAEGLRLNAGKFAIHLTRRSNV